MAAVTERITFLTNVLKLPLRSPLLVAKQVASIASISADRFRLGVGVSWMPEEFAWTGTDMRTRGRPHRRGHRHHQGGVRRRRTDAGSSTTASTTTSTG